jgi:hypothetical protein
MKLIAATAALLFAVPAVAQDSAPVTPPPAPAVTGPAAAAPTAPASALNLDTPIATLIENPAARAVLEADLPGMLQHPSLEQFKMLSLTQLAPYSQGLLTPELLTQVGAHLAAIR